MKLTRIRFCEEADQRLRQLKSRTGITPNLLCRMGFCLSLDDPMVPDPTQFPPDSQREIDRHTLTGQYDVLFLALLRERCVRDNLSIEGKAFEEQFRAHMNRGVLLLFQRVKSLPDVSKLVPAVPVVEC
ncbi:MAG: DNA sulfur modification protein DndE [Chloroflexi bacterium AL-W]|nr:DNA sulfur modification protein DndE [Chloroflexi bacterium AL-N1]NOK71044.1 DNA sulfur modification protein DndE [Chloroflexi bacterium AL-N10]NOK72733.1 DNA sulfur modification protein DndE [Chloroflexi bacterium AL-N5]NOK79179.1 DNA sulfur modification protein DndE [Chloroflexi bacterium AL-W]NOK87094.1 DNA sulfur modification protein DndE [Chloroflexi bacterium AL-N15]